MKKLTAHHQTCRFCGGPNKPSRRYCSDQCRRKDRLYSKLIQDRESRREINAARWAREIGS